MKQRGRQRGGINQADVGDGRLGGEVMFRGTNQSFSNFFRFFDVRQPRVVNFFPNFSDFWSCGRRKWRQRPTCRKWVFCSTCGCRNLKI